ncbi:MAG: type III-B CRISPR module RAMP protein Cmr4 [Geminicoccaceae bacterium]|nr:type III-B CRISPR module RAMP protein Cmr4 [Geminicoccaceae bacterium]
MLTRPFLLHALSPLHAGTGQAAGIVDLPIARYRSTGIPFVPGSSIKGVLRDTRRPGGEEKDPKLLAVFGPDTGNAAEHGGALVVGDARLLALPVRSFRGTFAWVSSPLLLELARRDLGEVASGLKLPSLTGRAARVANDSVCLFEKKIYLEDLDLPAQADPVCEGWARFLAPRVSPGEDIFSKRFVVVDDDTMSFLMETATQLDARVRLDPSTRTVAKGALWLEESLPPESLLVGLLAADRSRRNGLAMSPAEVLDFALANETVLQLGGKATVGRGRCRMVPIAAAGAQR